MNNQVFLFAEAFIWLLSPDYNKGENKITWKRGEKILRDKKLVGEKKLPKGKELIVITAYKVLKELPGDIFFLPNPEIQVLSNCSQAVITYVIQPRGS